MRTIFISSVALLVAVGLSAQSLKLVNANYPGIYCRFSANCQVSPSEQSDSFTPTNVAATCVLMSRSFPGTSRDTAGVYGYEYQITLNGNGNGQPTDTNILTVDSLTLPFGAPNYFSFSERASNQVWTVIAGGPVGLSPASASMDNSNNVTISFDPPLILNAQTDQSTNTLVFGMMSGGAPVPATAILSGSTQVGIKGAVSFKVKLRAQCPAQ
ncbi:MAG: hypothetical protein ACREFR_16770 [Limisphaerales bacterium]